MTAPSEPLMSTLIRFRQLLSAAVVWLSLFLNTAIFTHAAVDASVTQRIWKLKFGVTDAQMYVGGVQANGLNMTWLNGDADGDGIKNIDEITTGTNPFNPSKTITVASVARNTATDEAELQFPTENAKLYRIESTTTLANSASWAIQPGQVVGNGANRTLSAPYTANRFYRVRVDELDSDGDGVSDWVETEIALNPQSATTQPGINDLTFVTTQLNTPNVVTIKATQPFASEDGPQAGTFSINRTQKLLPLTVNLSASGTATAGTHYTSSGLPGTVAFAAGAETASVSVNPIQRSNVEGSKSVTATLVAAAVPEPPYSVGTNNQATVIINDSTTPTGTGLLARYYDHANGTLAHAANFGDAGNYTFTLGSPTTTGTIVVTPTSGNFSGLQIGQKVKLSFSGGNLSNALYNHAEYTVTAKTVTTFTCSITSPTALPASSTSAGCNYSIQSYTHPPRLERIDPVVNNEWMTGTPNGVTVAAAAGTTATNVPDNYSTTYETYLHPTIAGSYRFQLDADDKARVLIDLNRNGTFDLPGEQVVEHGWDGSATVGNFKISASYALQVPTGAAERYKMRVEHVETTGAARCRLQWSRDGGGFTNIDQSPNLFTHTQAATYTFTRTNTTSGTATINLNSHGLTSTAPNNTATLAFSNGTLFLPNTSDLNGYSKAYTVATVPNANTFTVAITGTNLPANQSAGVTCYLENRPTSATTGVYNKIYTTTNFQRTPGRIGIDGHVTISNGGNWGEGTPDAALIDPDTFSARWSGQVQPQFTEEYTFIVQADDGCALRINGQNYDLKTLPSTFNDGSTYLHNSTTGHTVINYMNARVRPGSFIVGETLRFDPTSGNLNHPGGSTYTYDSTSGLAVVNYSNLTTVTPGSLAAGQYIEVDPTAGTASALATARYTITAATATTFTIDFGVGAFPSQTTAAAINVSDNRDAVVTAVYAAGTGTYTYTSSTGATVIDYSALGIPSNTFQANQTIPLDPTSGILSGQPNAFKVITATTATTFTVSYPTGLGNTTGSVIIVAPSSGAVPVGMTAAFAVNFEPGRYANSSVGNVNLEIFNKELKNWTAMGNERYVRIPMVGGVRYNIELDYWEDTGFARCLLSWFSPSQPKQVIPSNRLYPASGPIAPPAHVTSADAAALVGGVFNFPIAGSNGATVTISGNPAWLSFSNGALVGTPPAGSAGDFQVLVTISGPDGTSTSVVNVHVENTGATIVREHWNGISGTSVATIPVSTPPTGTANLSSLEAPTNAGDNYGTRIRGYITAPTTGNYYFWIAANNTAELWISNDDEPVNTIKRAWVSNGTASRQWTAEANQKSPWLALEAGKKYYVEILQKAATGTGDNLAVGWLKPDQTGIVPSEIVPGYVLSPYVPPAPGSTPGTLYIATMLSQNAALTKGVGTSTLRLSEDESSAVMTYSYSNLTGPITSQHIHTDPYLGHASAIVFDIDVPETPGDGLQPDGSYKWTINPIGTLSKAEIVEIIKQGKAYINLHTALYPAGEIRGNYTLANGSRTFTVPPPPPSWTSQPENAHTNASAAMRFLTQATFGVSVADIAALKAIPGGYEEWIDNQLALFPESLQLPEVMRTENASAQGGAFIEELTFNAWWRNSVSGPDQLRQRIAFALSEILVVSADGPLDNQAQAVSYFYDKLAQHAFGNFRDILEVVTLTPGMGRYLDMLRNDKPDLTVGRIPNENYAREIKQLFSIGLFRMWPDGTLILNSKDSPIETYTQREIVGFAHVFTGWDYGYNGTFRISIGAATDWTRQMREIPARHFTGPKRVLNNEVLPGLPALGGQPLDPYANHNSTHFGDPAYQNLPAEELAATHDQLFNHPNVGPFICRQLIQRLVTSHPSRDYLYRVVQKFNDNGSGVRGDMPTVIKAILLDHEARSLTEATKPAFGKQREPLLRVSAAARAFRTAPFTATYTQNGTTTITIDLAPPGSPHRLLSGNNAFLEFKTPTSGSGGAPWIGSYIVTPLDTDSFTVQAQGWAGGTYSIPANSTTCTVTMNSHWLQTGHKIYVDFTSGTADGDAGLDSTVYQLTSATPETGTGSFTFEITAGEVSTTLRTGSLMIPRFSPGSYTIGDLSPAVAGQKRITMDTNFDHHLSVGDQVQLNFYGGNPLPADTVVTIENVVDLNTYTALLTVDGTNNYGTNQGIDQVFQFPLVSLPLTRSGPLTSRPSTFVMNNTRGTLDQSPVYSPTVFNYFLPDFKFPGALASQGITTPEFQTTAETTVVRQANFIYDGIFNLTNTNGLSSFRTGGNGANNALVMDFSPWMGLADATPGSVGEVFGEGPQPTQTWASNANLSTLIDRLSTLLVAGPLSTSAKEVISKFLLKQITHVGTGANVTITSPGHGLVNGDTIYIYGVSGGTNINGTRIVTVLTPDTLRIPVNVITAPTSEQLAAAHFSAIDFNNQETPTAAHKVNRLRAIIHLILTSPDFTIQR